MCLLLCESGQQNASSRDRTENFDEEVNSLEIRKFVIIGIDADAEKQACISPVDNFVIPELVYWSALKSGCN